MSRSMLAGVVEEVAEEAGGPGRPARPALPGWLRRKWAAAHVVEAAAPGAGAESGRSVRSIRVVVEWLDPD